MSIFLKINREPMFKVHIYLHKHPVKIFLMIKKIFLEPTTLPGSSSKFSEIALSRGA